MVNAAIEIEGLTKQYRRLRGPARPAVQNLDLTVPEGGVFGFLGPNGSGKTTTLRILTGLVRADSGTVRVLGARVPRQLPHVMGSVGALIEEPRSFPTFSARQNLRLLARTAEVPAGRARVDEVLELVDLTDRADERVKNYSLGMKQRLGIAMALLKSPRLLILDEPTNGLDALGILEVRQLIATLGASGITVLLSSHQLNEVQQVCDRVAIMVSGSVVAQGTIADLLAGGDGGTLLVRAPHSEAVGRILRDAGLRVVAAEGAWLVSGVGDPSGVTMLLADAGHYVSELRPVRSDLEAVFLDAVASAEGAADGTADSAAEGPLR